MKQNTLFASAALFLSAQAAEGTFDYKQQGDDWTGTCASGREQSPIDFHALGMAYSEKLNLATEGYINYSPLTVTNTGDTIKASGVTEGVFTKTFWDGSEAKFVPLQFHFHAPSEHTIGGLHYDLEMHVVHTYEDGSLGGVIGILFDRVLGGQENNSLLSSINAASVSPAGTSR
jgi:carbonic anhydrase